MKLVKNVMGTDADFIPLTITVLTHPAVGENNKSQNNWCKCLLITITEYQSCTTHNTVHKTLYRN